MSPECDVLINIHASHVALSSHIWKLRPAKAEQWTFIGRKIGQRLNIYQGENWTEAKAEHLLAGNLDKGKN